MSDGTRRCKKHGDVSGNVGKQTCGSYPQIVGKCVTKHWDVRREKRKCMGICERLLRHYASHQEINSSATSTRAPGFDYGEDFQ